MQSAYSAYREDRLCLRARGPPGVLGDLCSVCILHIGRIGSD